MFQWVASTRQKFVFLHFGYAKKEKVSSLYQNLFILKGSFIIYGDVVQSNQ